MAENAMDLKDQINELWERADQLSPRDTEAVQTVEAVIDLLDTGKARVAELQSSGFGGEGEGSSDSSSSSSSLEYSAPTGNTGDRGGSGLLVGSRSGSDQDDGQSQDEDQGQEQRQDVVVHEWLKKAILLLFRLRSIETTSLGPFEYADKLPLKKNFAEAGVRVVPGASARWGSFISRGVILMPSYVNIGAWIGEGSMVDTWATVASCAQIGARVHLSGGVGIGGVLEPPNAVPVVIEDDAFIGSRCMVTDGARVGKGAVLGAGTILNPSIPVYDAQTGIELSRGYVPAWSVAVTASRRREFPGGEYFLPCVLVIKRLEAGERHNKLELNEILREHGVST